MHLSTKPLVRTLAVVGVTALIRWGDIQFGDGWARVLFPHSDPTIAAAAAELVSLLWYVVPVAVLVTLLHGKKYLWDELGLRHRIGRAMGFAVAFTMPMFVCFAWIGTLASGQEIPLLVLAQARAAFREEVFYRAFLFGQLFRHGRWGFVPAVALNAVVFAAGHLYQAQSVVEGVAIFAITLIGAVWFAWLFVAWGYNLWLPIGLHFFMNLWWELFRVDATAFSGSVVVEAARLLTVLGSIGWTLWILRQQGRSALSSHALWWQNEREGSK